MKNSKSPRYYLFIFLMFTFRKFKNGLERYARQLETGRVAKLIDKIGEPYFDDLWVD